MLKNDLEDMDRQTALHVTGGSRHSSSWRWGLLDTIKNMAAWSSFKIVGELVEPSESEDHRKLQTTEEFDPKLQTTEDLRRRKEVKKEKHCSNIVRRCWSKRKEQNHGQRLPKESRSKDRNCKEFKTNRI